MKTDNTLAFLTLLGFGSLLYLSVSSCSDAAKKTPPLTASPAPVTASAPNPAPQTPPTPTAPTGILDLPSHKEIYIDGTPVLTTVETKVNPSISCTLCLKCHKQ
jgi:hypothetical protein